MLAYLLELVQIDLFSLLLDINFLVNDGLCKKIVFFDEV